MKYLKHKIYGALFSLFKVFPIKKNRITFIVDSKESFKGNLDYIKREFERRGDFEYDFFYKDRLSFSAFKNLATSRFVFLNDNFFPIAFMNFKDETVVVQLWHAPGASKKFGASVDAESAEILAKISANTDYLIISSKNIEDEYCEAFQMPKDKIKPLGLPRADYYFEDHDIDGLKREFFKRYGVSEDKKIILYAPTFRDEEKYNNVFDYLDLESFNIELGDEYILALRLHPKIRDFYSGDISAKGEYIDCSDYPSEQELLLMSDILITDYSSIMIEFAMLQKPVVFFTYDFDSYMTNERGFYFDFRSTVPGPIVEDSNQLINTIKNKDFNEIKLSEFVKTQFDEIDGKASERVVDFLLKYGG
ncbi:CDP-glycerol glycerophosphotransferase family protein [uncultured Methanobrevibacter sp.]|uniref:CDP-glycerol glycerophosphotransferase family protein n=1 Tax=uncultured Methanobrevibacter sp. TaxID=253161 RepID=UPI002639CA15|nr:CDP-glycerol glycerophosphotransferase family protein [uncultured Methanobrevibacter sp.]